MFFIFCPYKVHAGEVGEYSFTGNSEIPFPSFLPLDYEIARARAWLIALEQAEKYLPASASLRLWNMDCDNEAGRLAFTALLFPVVTATPDISSSRNIQVFLSRKEDLDTVATSIFETPERYILQLALLMDLQTALKELEKNRPVNVAESEKLAPKLDPWLMTLKQVWQISRKLEAGNDLERALDEAIDIPGRSLPVLLQSCKKKLEARENQSALAQVEEIIQQLDDESSIKMPDLVKQHLLGSALHIRGIGHWRQDQLALAESDLSRAIKLMQDKGIFRRERGDIFIDLGRLQQIRQDLPGMCASFRQACVLGQCAELAEMRRQNLCQDE